MFSPIIFTKLVVKMLSKIGQRLEIQRTITRSSISSFRKFVPILQNFATQASLKINQDEIETKLSTDISLENAHPHESIPGPSKFEIIRSLLPGGNNFKKSASEMLMNFRDEHGLLFNFRGLFGRSDIIVSFNPDDFSTVFRNEGKWPNRLPLDTLKYHREQHRRDFFQGVEGIVSTNDEKWANIRSVVNPILMKPQNIIIYLNSMLEVNNEFLERIREIRDPKSNEMPENFEDELNSLTFETVAAVALNTQLGLLRKNRDNPEVKVMFNNLKRYFELAFKLDLMPSIWRIVKTPNAHETMRILDSITSECNRYITEALERIENDPDSNVGREKSILEKLAKIDKKIAVVMAIDLLQAGVDTTSSTITAVLLCLAKNPEKQEKLFEELKNILPEKDSILTVENMRNLPYLRACIKEGLRVYPITQGTLRKLPEDVVLSGYRIRAGTDILVASNLLLSDEKYVPRAQEYLPERWIRSENSNSNLFGQLDNPFLYLPFGFGPRSCVGKRLVNLELEITIARLVRNFKIGYNYSVENAFTEKLIRVPNIPLKYQFEER